MSAHRLNCLIVISVFLLSSCSSNKDSAPVNYNKSWQDIPDATPQRVEKSRYGNPNSYEVLGKTYFVMESSEGFAQKGIASWYGEKFHGRKTSSGEDYNMYSMTAAHKTLPIPVYVEVTNLDNNRKAIVRVNDRGPFHTGRIIDLSYAAATRLGVAQTGTANVSIRVVNEYGEPDSHSMVESPVDAGGKIYVQVAAYASEENALQQLGLLQGEGFNDVRLHIESKKGNTLYRIRIGPLPTAQVAKQLLTELEQNNHRNLKIVSAN